VTKVIYDIGANNGDDIEYYLKKADLVVAVEANPVLCRQIAGRFSDVIQDGRLILVNCVLTVSDFASDVSFYLHRTNHVKSQFPRPLTGLVEFEEVRLPAKSVLALFTEFGPPWYVKIDIEGYDHVVLSCMLAHGIVPELISVEAHSAAVFPLLAVTAGYQAFNIVEGYDVHEKYHCCPIAVREGTELYSFPRHSAGPFGDDISGDWLSRKQCFQRMLSEGMGWKDVHARNPDMNWARKITPLRFVLYWYYRFPLESRGRSWTSRVIGRFRSAVTGTVSRFVNGRQ